MGGVNLRDHCRVLGLAVVWVVFLDQLPVSCLDPTQGRSFAQSEDVQGFSECLVCHSLALW